MEFKFNDGGRAAAGYKGFTGDCATRAIAIATNIPYQNVYNALQAMNKLYAENHHDRVAKSILKGGGGSGTTPSNGVFKIISCEYLISLGWEWVPTMRIGQGCRVHLKSNELPSGRLIVQVSKHLVAVIDGVIHDTHDCSRGGTRCVYGYFQKKK